MKRTLCFLFALLFLASLCACSEAPPPEQETSTVATTEAPTTEALFTTTEPPTLLPATENWSDWIEAFPVLKEPANDYWDLLGRYRKIQDGGTMSVKVYIILYDMDGDFVPELLVQLDAYPLVQWQVYTMQKGKTRWLGSFGAKDSDLFSCSDGGIYKHTAHMTGEALYRVTIQGNQLQEKILFSRDHGNNPDPGYWSSPDSVRLLTQELNGHHYYNYE